MKRSHETLQKEFTSYPDDVYTIKHQSGVLRNVIVVNITNEGRGENFPVTFNNVLKAWKELKMLADLGRTVLHQTDDQEPIPYADSEPYRYRFGGE